MNSYDMIDKMTETELEQYFDNQRSIDSSIDSAIAEATKEARPFTHISMTSENYFTETGSCTHVMDSWMSAGAYIGGSAGLFLGVYNANSVPDALVASPILSVLGLIAGSYAFGVVGLVHCTTKSVSNFIRARSNPESV